MDPRREFNKAALSQKGNGVDFLVFRGTSRYQYGQGLGDVLRGIVRYIPIMTQFLKPVAMKAMQTFFKAGSEAINKGATVIRRNQVHAQTYGRCGIRRHGRPGRLQAN